MGFRFFNLCSISKLDPLLKSSSRYRPIHPSISSTTLLFHSLNPHFKDHHPPPPISFPRYQIPKRWHFVHSHDDDHHHDQPSSGKPENVFRLGLAADIGLATGKAFTGYLSGSTAIIADAAHSVSDVVLSAVALWSFKAGQAPKDKEHPYGHSKFESLGALGISCMLLATAGGIAWHALDILMVLLSTSPEAVNHSLIHDHTHGHAHSGHHHGVDMQYPVLALSMTVVSISVKEGLYWVTKKAGDKQGSGLMKANAWHHRADAVSSVVALIGVGGSLLGVKFLDPLAGIVVSGMILKAGLETGYQSVLELVDAAIPSEELDPLRKTILEVEGVKGCHRMRGRRAGSSIYLDVHIEVDPFLSVSAAHGIGESVRQEIHKSHRQIAEVFIHIDPAFLRLSPSMMKQQPQQGSRGGMAHQNTSSSLDEKDIELIVSNIFSTKFPEKIAVERITHHLLQGKIFLQIEVSMAPDVYIRDAREVAEEAEKEILKAASDIIQVNFELILGRPIPKFN